jgi:putative ABC transport system permease protein
MGPGDVLRFAVGALGGHRVRTGLSLTGVAIGVLAVVLLTSLGEGARAYVVGEFAALGTNLIIVLPGKTETTGLVPITGGTPRDLTLEDAEAVRRRVAAVRRIAPIVLGSATARYRERSREITVFGTTAEWFAIRGLSAQMGRLLPAETELVESQVCVLGAAVKRELFPDANPLGEMLRLGSERCRIVGVATPRGVTIGLNVDEMVFVPVRRAMTMFNRTGLFRLMVEVRSHGEIPATRQAIVRVLAERHDGQEDVTALTQDAVLATFGRILGVLTAVLAGIAAISLAVAGIGIMNVMLVSVAERTREIGLLKALGASRRQILTLFLVEAAVLALLGGLVGVALASSSTALVRGLFPAFPVTTPRWAVAAALAVSVTVGLLFGVLPANRAARVDPVVALAGRA